MRIPSPVHVFDNFMTFMCIYSFIQNNVMVLDIDNEYSRAGKVRKKNKDG